MKENHKKDKKNSVVKNKISSEFNVQGDDAQGSVKPEYKKMLNNLLGIGTGDNSVFLSSKVTNFDVAKILDPEDLEKVFTTDSFEVEVQESAFGESMLSILNDSESADEFIEIIYENGFTLTIPSATLYSPLILKKVEIKISNTNKVYIASIDDSVEINEKLLFSLQNQYHFEIPLFYIYKIYIIKLWFQYQHYQ